MITEILQPNEANIRKCALTVRDGGIVAFPTETVYGLGANAFDPKAAAKIYEAKGRPSDNPLIVHVYGAEQIAEVAREIPPEADKLISEFMPGALTLILKKKESVPDSITGGRDTVGVRMPSCEVCRKFLKACGVPVCAPSANISGSPSPTCAKHVERDLAGKIRYILDGGDCEIGLESTIIDLSGDEPAILRAGGVSAEAVSEVLGKTLRTVSGGDAALCPGMKYKHYSPKAEVYFSAYYESMAAGIAAKYDSLAGGGERPVIMCLDSAASGYGTRNVFRMGANYDDFARNLFSSLRRADESGYTAVIAEGVPAVGIGAAIVNRLIKSSGGKII